MSRLDDYNRKTQEAYDRVVKYYGTWFHNYNSKPEEKHLVTFEQMQMYFSSDECDWSDMPNHPSDRKFYNQLRQYCGILKNNGVAPDDRTALEFIAESRVVLDWQTISEAKRRLGTSWQEGVITYDQAGQIFRMMAKKLLQDMFIRPIRAINAVNFSELEPSDDSSNRSHQFWTDLSNVSVSSLGKRKCHLCGKPAIFDTNVCYEHNPK